MGELLITVGVVVLLYVGWQLWFGDLILSAQGNAVGQQQLDAWASQAPTDAATALPTATAPDAGATPPATPVAVEPPVMPEAGDTEVFAVMQIPRFGSDYKIEVAGGVTRVGTLDKTRIGHYMGTEMPGQLGNFALAAHRTTYGAPFNRLADLRVGDAIVLTTQDGWYVYRFRNHEYVEPTAVEVLADVPQAPDLPPDARYITLTSCSPMFSMTERIIAYGVFESYVPRTQGEPAALGGAASHFSRYTSAASAS